MHQGVDSWLAMVRGLAQQWFGVWIRPKAPADEWLTEGLAAYLEHLFIAKFLGRNEALYRWLESWNWSEKRCGHHVAQCTPCGSSLSRSRLSCAQLPAVVRQGCES